MDLLIASLSVFLARPFGSGEGPCLGGFSGALLFPFMDDFVVFCIGWFTRQDF